MNRMNRAELKKELIEELQRTTITHTNRVQSLKVISEATAAASLKFQKNEVNQEESTKDMIENAQSLLNITSELLNLTTYLLEDEAKKGIIVKNKVIHFLEKEI